MCVYNYTYNYFCKWMLYFFLDSETSHNVSESRKPSEEFSIWLISDKNCKGDLLDYSSSKE